MSVPGTEREKSPYLNPANAASGMGDRQGKDAEQVARPTQQFPRVERWQMENRISAKHFMTLGILTICNIVLDNGYQIVGQSAYVDKRNFDKQFGEHLAYENAISQMWPLFDFLLAEDLHKAKKVIGN